MDPVKAILAFCAALFFVLSLVLNVGFDPSQFPVPQNAPPAGPAGYTFAIWGLICVWLLASTGAGLFKRATDPAWEPSRLPLILSLGPGAAWAGVALLSPVWATVLICWMLLTALRALALTPTTDRLLLRAPLALYAGSLTAAAWISVALIAAGRGVGPGETGWALIAIVGMLATGAAVQTRLTRAPEYGAALAWALIGIAVANAADNTAVALAGALGAIATGALAWQAR